MDILKDIAEIVKDDKEHNVEVKVDPYGVTVNLDYDPDKDFGEKCIIPVVYTPADGFAFIPQKELNEKFQPGDYGLDLNEIKLIKKIMEYLEDNNEGINNLCNIFDLSARHLQDGQLIDRFGSNFNNLKN